MTTTTRTFDYSQLSAFDRGAQLAMLVLSEGGTLGLLWEKISEQVHFLNKLNCSKAGRAIIKKIRIEKDASGNLVGATSAETSQFAEQTELLMGMLTTMEKVLDLCNAAKAQAEAQAAAT
jgi:hypothetical protein